MAYAIICNARNGKNIGIEVVAYVDRKKTKKLWWTSDSPGLIMRFNSKTAARLILKNIRFNNPEVVDYQSAVSMINEQVEEIDHGRCMMEAEAGWDGHK